MPWTSSERSEVKAYPCPLSVLTIYASKYQLVSAFVLITELLLLGWLTKGDLANGPWLLSLEVVCVCVCSPCP